MGYYSDVMIATTKKDYEKVKKSQEKFEINIFDQDAEITDYKENEKDCVFLRLYSIKYYDQFEKIQALEKALEKTDA